tara:strand:+ start:32 stop:613 length:582 start_codon:yes stop_codon:yes gene_type:complete
MNIPSRILGAAALVPIFGFTCGALAAAAIDTTPVTGGHDDYLADIPAQQMQTVSPEQAKAMQARANHYPLETPDGTIEVAELAYHGRLRNRLSERALYEARYGEGYLYDVAAEEERDAVAEAMPDMAWPVDPAVVTGIGPHEGTPLDAGDEMLIYDQPVEAPAQPVNPEIAYRDGRQGGPRMINVAAELATHQ